LQLVDADAQDIPLEGAELLCRPVPGDRRDPRVELVRVRGDRLGEPSRELVDLARVVRAERLAG
jgi:hypothetical protein